MTKYYDYGEIINDKTGKKSRWIRSYEPQGDFRGYIDGNKITLYPADFITGRHFDVHVINIYDLKTR